MITGLAGASIWSEDLNNLLPFYRDVLGLEVSVQTPGFVVLGELGLGTHSQVRGRNADPARHMVGLATDCCSQRGEAQPVVERPWRSPSPSARPVRFRPRCRARAWPTE